MANGHLIVIAVGPVKGFIVSARRTRDFWSGSHMLSEISKAVAGSIGKAGGQLIFPCPTNASDLENDSTYNVANLILAELSAGISPEDVKDTAYASAQTRWMDFVTDAKSLGSPLIDDDLWYEQEKDASIIETYAAWVPMASKEDYPRARKRVMQLLDARKCCRDFGQAPAPHHGIPKSSLSGARETVLKIVKGNHKKTIELRQDILGRNPELAQRLRLSAGEELDIVDFTKRAIRKSFPSVTRVALDPWLRRIAADKGEGLELINRIAEACKGASFATGTGDHYKALFPFDGAVLYPARIQRMIAVNKRSSRSNEYASFISERDRAALEAIAVDLDKIIRGTGGEPGYGEPDPYVAIIAADGDQMGKAISLLTKSKNHQEFSKLLASFSESAQGILTKHSGCLVYSGGDDVLGLVPVDNCLSCAWELHHEFGSLFKEVAGEWGVTPLTLSIGIAIGHSREPLEDLLEYTYAAEKAAKHPDRDGLAIHVHTRAGTPIKIRDRWSNEVYGRLSKWIELFGAGIIPSGAAYDLRELARVYGGWPDTGETKAAIEKDINRLLTKKRSPEGGGELPQIIDRKRLLSALGSSFDDEHRVPGYHPGVLSIVNEWLIAHRIAQSIAIVGTEENNAVVA